MTPDVLITSLLQLVTAQEAESLQKITVNISKLIKDVVLSEECLQVLNLSRKNLLDTVAKCGSSLDRNSSTSSFSISTSFYNQESNKTGAEL